MILRGILEVMAVLVLPFIVTVVMPIWRFVVRREDIYLLYNGIYDSILSTDKIFVTPMVAETKHFEFCFQTSREASVQVEKSINETLEYYNKLGYIIITSVPEFQADEKKLCEMRTEVRRLRLNYKN